MTTPTALVTFDDVVGHLNLTGTDYSASVNELQGFIDAATEFVEYQTGPIIPRPYTNEVHSGGGPVIVLDHPPVLTVDSVTEFLGPTSFVLTDAELGGTSGLYAYSLDNPDEGVICRRTIGGLVTRFASGYRNVLVSYTAGRNKVPADVRMAVLEDIRGLFTQTQYSNRAGSFGAGSEMPDSWAASSSNPVGTFPRLAALLAAKTRTPSIA